MPGFLLWLILGNRRRSLRSFLDLSLEESFTRLDQRTALLLPADYACKIPKIHSALNLFINSTLRDRDEWTAWKCCEGQTTNIRTHLRENHWKVYREVVVKEKLKYWDEIAQMTGPTALSAPKECEPFTLEGFFERLVKWVVVDDQVSFTFFFLYCLKLTALQHGYVGNECCGIPRTPRSTFIHWD